MISRLIAKLFAKLATILTTDGRAPAVQVIQHGARAGIRLVRESPKGRSEQCTIPAMHDPSRKGRAARRSRPMISERTKDALAKAKQRGVVLGNPNVGKMNTEAAAARDAGLKPILQTMSELSYREIADELTNRKIPAPRGGVWNAMSVMRATKRLGLAAK